MLKDNLIMLRNINGFSQEIISEKIGISRQAYAKWEKGATIPDIEKCKLLADIYGITIDSLIKTEKTDCVGIIPPAPKGKHIWGSVTVNEKGQIVIPKEARDTYNITSGTRLIVLGDDDGMAMITAERFEENMRKILETAFRKSEE